MADVVVPTEPVSDVLLWIDGDSCPKNLRAILLRAIVRTGIRATFVADRPLPDVLQAMADHTAALRRQVKALVVASGVPDVPDVPHHADISYTQNVFNVSDVSSATEPLDIPKASGVRDVSATSGNTDVSGSPYDAGASCNAGVTCNTGVTCGSDGSSLSVPTLEPVACSSSNHVRSDSADVPSSESAACVSIGSARGNVMDVPSSVSAASTPSAPFPPIDNIRAVRTPIAMVVVDTGADSADDYIVEHAAARTLAVTHDVPLAARLVEKELVVLDDRGGCFTPANMRERLSLRNAMTEFREMGIYAERGRGIGVVETKAFADALDRQLVELLRRFPDGQVALHPERMLAR